MTKLLAQDGSLEFEAIQGPSGYTPSTGAGVSGYSTALEKILSNVIGFLTIVGGLTFLFYFLTGAITWITAGGDQTKVEKAKKYMTDAAIGLIIISLSYAISYIVGTILGIEILNPANVIKNLGPGGSGGQDQTTIYYPNNGQYAAD